MQVLALLGAVTTHAASLTAVDGQEKARPSGWNEKKNQDGKVVQELKIEAPTMTEEDQYGYVMPDRYRCDSCKAVMYHLNEELTKKHPKSKRLKQWEYTDLFDDTCRTAFQGYGIKLIGGENVLSGPGLKDKVELAPGQGMIQMGGDSWTKRLAEICRKIVYEKVGEEEIYDKFYKGLRGEDPAETGLSEDFCRTEMGECREGPKTPPPRPRSQEARARSRPRPRPRPRPREEATSASSEAPVDVQTFLRSLATKHGLTSDEYVASRTPREWEKLMLAVGGRIFNKMADAGADSCSAR